VLCLVAALGYDATARWAMRLLMLGDPGSAALILGRSRPSGDAVAELAAMATSADPSVRGEVARRLATSGPWLRDLARTSRGYPIRSLSRVSDACAAGLQTTDGTETLVVQRSREGPREVRRRQLPLRGRSAVEEDR
jgi:hypothetical protein